MEYFENDFQIQLVETRESQVSKKAQRPSFVENDQNETTDTPNRRGSGSPTKQIKSPQKENYQMMVSNPNELPKTEEQIEELKEFYLTVAENFEIYDPLNRDIPDEDNNIAIKCHQLRR